MSAQQPLGQIILITGCMFSGKTQELIRRVSSARATGRKVQVFYPKMDTRPMNLGERPGIRSHNGMSMEAIAVDRPEDVKSLVLDETSVVAVDEIQFFES